MVVSINLAHRPIKRPKFVGQGGEIQYFFHAAKALDLVVINDQYQVVEVMMWGKEDGFPIGPFIHFAIAE